MEKDNMEHASEPNLNLKSFLANAYLHPIFHLFEEPAKEEESQETVEVRIDKAQQQQQQQQRDHQEETHVRSSSHYHHESHVSRSTQYHEGIHVRSDTDSPSPPHFIYHYDIQP
jgi:hypothetical protein